MSNESHRRGPVAALLVAGAAAAVYATALGNGFVWDDHWVLHELPSLRGLAEPFFPPPSAPLLRLQYYRPLMTLSFQIDRALGGGRPLAFHLTSIALHALASGLLALLFLRLLGAGSLLAATLGALAFALHPVHVEAVAWMGGRPDVMATIGIVAAVLAFGRWLDSRRGIWLLAGAGGLLFGMLSKEVALTGVVLVAGLPWVWPLRDDAPPLDRAARWAIVGVGVAVAGVCLSLRAAALDAPAGEALASPVPLTEQALALLGALGFYAEAMLWPQASGAVRTAAPVDPGHVLAGVATLVIGALGVALALRRRARLAVLALAWIGVTLAPAFILLVRKISETRVADRYAYVPSAGVALLLALGLARWGRGARATVGLALVALAGLTAWRVPVFRDDLSFWRNAVAAVPDEGYAHERLARTLAQAGDQAAAEAEFRLGLTSRFSPGQRPTILNNLGFLLLEQQRFAEAEPLFTEAVAESPRFAGPYRGLAECRWQRARDLAHEGREDEARSMLPETRALLEQAIAFEPAAARSAYLLGRIHLVEGDRTEAARWFAYAVEAAPGTTTAEEAQAELSALQ